MYRVILILLIVVCSATSAGARHHRHRYHVVVPDPYLLQHNAPVTGRLEPYQSDRSRSEVVRPPALSRDGTGGVIPPDWKQQPLDNGGRTAIGVRLAFACSRHDKSMAAETFQVQVGCPQASASEAGRKF